MAYSFAVDANMKQPFDIDRILKGDKPSNLPTKTGQVRAGHKS
jgi:hypothetical protein